MRNFELYLGRCDSRRAGQCDDYVSVVCIVLETWTRLQRVRYFVLKMGTVGRQDVGTVP